MFDPSCCASIGCVRIMHSQRPYTNTSQTTVRPPLSRAIPLDLPRRSLRCPRQLSRSRVGRALPTTGPAQARPMLLQFETRGVPRTPPPPTPPPPLPDEADAQAIDCRPFGTHADALRFRKPLGDAARANRTPCPSPMLRSVSGSCSAGLPSLPVGSVHPQCAEGRLRLHGDFGRGPLGNRRVPGPPFSVHSPIGQRRLSWSP